MYFGLDLKLVPCQYLLTKYVNKSLLQKFEIHIGCLYEMNEILFGIWVLYKSAFF